MLAAVFLITAALTLALLAAVAWSIARPHQRLWPPPQQHPAQFALLWLLTALIAAGTLATGLLDWNPHGLPAVPRGLIGGGLLLVGNAVAWSAAWQTGLLAVGGKNAPLITTGLYARTRNPQYVGDLIMVAGWAALSASPAATLLCALCAATFVLFPFAEEPWLRALHPHAYADYCQRVARFA